MNRLTFTSVSSNCESNQHLCRVHFIFPEQQPPYQRTGLLDQGESVEVKLSSGPFFIVVHRYSNVRLLRRDFSTIDPRQSFCDFGAYVIRYTLEKANANYTVNNNYFAQMEQAINTLNQYVDYDLTLLQQRKPAQESLRYTHSVFYNLEGFNPSLKVPYVSLVGRGRHLLKGIRPETLKKWQDFFISFMPQFFRECSYSAAKFGNVSSQETLEPADRYFLYNCIVTVFSYIVRKKIQYRPDSEVTPFRDYVGLNIIDNAVVGDCEDQSQMVFDMLRIFKRLFPTEATNRFNGANTLCYHISHWLQNAYLWMVQGAVGDAANKTHVWCALLPFDGGPAHYIESTGEGSPNFYKFLIRAWKMAKNNTFEDAILIDPNSGSYGLRSSCLTMVEANARPIFNQWAYLNTTIDINKELEFATLLDAPIIHPMRVLMHFK